jgi:hypothetical protein
MKYGTASLWSFGLLASGALVLARKASHSALAILVVPMLAGVLSSPAHAQVTIPNTFTDGTPALAADVNENFAELAGALNTLNCATAAEVTCNPALSCPACPSCPAAPACDTLGSYNQGFTEGGNGVEITSDNAAVCTTAGGTYDAVADSCSVDITTDNAAAAAAAGSAACTQAGGTWNAGTSTCTAASNYNCFVGGFCAQAAILFPPASYSWLPTNVYDGHTQGAGAALAAGCNTHPGSVLWLEGDLVFATCCDVDPYAFTGTSNGWGIDMCE